MDNNLNWKEFNFKDLFTIQSGYYNKKPPFKTDGTIPFIGATALNNGITGFCSSDDVQLYSKKGQPTENTLENKIFEGNCITVTNNGSIGYAFYQNEKFTSSQDINVLYLKDYTLNRDIALFLCVMIQQQRVCFAYSRKWKPTRMKKSTLILPADDCGGPDYVYMEKYVEQVYNLKIKEYLSYIKQRKDDLKYVEIEPLTTKKWEPFYITDLFEIGSGKRLTKADMENGTTPFIGATSFNNGITNYVSNINESMDSNVLGVNYNGSVVENFYHPYECLFSDDVKRFHLKNYVDSKYVLLFFKSIILKQKVKYMYGYKFNSERMSKQVILVPVNELGLPDYEYMEQYMINEELDKLISYESFIRSKS